MAETIGKISNIKVGSFLPGSINEFDICTLTLTDPATGASGVFYLWNSRTDAPALQRVLDTQRLALARDAAIHNLSVHVWHEDDSSIILQMQVDVG